MKDLLTAIQQRGDSKLTEFGYGIMTADRHVKNMEQLAGVDACYAAASSISKQTSYHDILQKAKKTLVYSNDEMLVQEKGIGRKEAETILGNDEIEIPKNTLIIFKHVLTTPKKDRDGDILRTIGAIPDPKMLLLWQHVHTLPVGKLLVPMSHNEKQLVMLSCVVDINELSHDAAVMVDNDMARFSHGFRALEWSQLKESEGDTTGGPLGFDITKFEIMEESIVSVPSNTDAEVIDRVVSLVEAGKLTSGIMKECGKTLRSQMNVSVQSGIDVSTLEKEGETKDAAVDDESIETDKETGTAEPASEETEVVPGADDKGTETTEQEQEAGLDEGVKETEVEEKAGRRLSASYMKTLKSCIDDLQSILDSDKDMARGSQAICERCMNRLQRMVDDNSSNDEEDGKETEVPEMTVEDAIAKVACASEADRTKMSNILRLMEDINRQDSRIDQFKQFMQN